jgi:hypothetical protein
MNNELKRKWRQMVVALKHSLSLLGRIGKDLRNASDEWTSGLRFVPRTPCVRGRAANPTSAVFGLLLFRGDIQVIYNSFTVIR